MIVTCADVSIEFAIVFEGDVAFVVFLFFEFVFEGDAAFVVFF